MFSRFLSARRALLSAVVSVVCVALLVGVSAPAGAQGSVRGFDGSTIKVAGFGVESLLPTLGESAQARFKRFNDTNEVKGVKIEMTEFTDDGGETATALSIARRLVTQDQVFAVIPEASSVTPSEYLTQQKVPWFGGGFSVAYCSPKPSTTLWGFAPQGCFTPEDPSFVTDNLHNTYTYVAEKSGKKDPTLAIIASDNLSGDNAVNVAVIAAEGAGFDVVQAKANLPLTVSDFTPYAQQLQTANDGEPPDAVYCMPSIQCLNIWGLLKPDGYEGVFFHGLYTDALVKPFEGSYAITGYADFTTPSPGLDQMREDLNAYKAGAGDALDFGDVMGYGAADMFVTALTKVAAKGKSNITQENVQKAASRLKWQLPGFIKVSYPKATVMSFPQCNSLVLSTGDGWDVVEKWTCSTKTYSPNRKAGG